GLVKDVNDLKSTVGGADSGLVKSVNSLSTTVGDKDSGLVKSVTANTSSINEVKNLTGNSKLVTQVTTNKTDIASLQHSEISADYTIYIGTTKGLAASYDGGYSWTTLLSGKTVNNILLYQGVLYAATSTGLYFSYDFGKNWQGPKYSSYTFNTVSGYYGSVFAGTSTGHIIQTDDAGYGTRNIATSLGNIASINVTDSANGPVFVVASTKGVYVTDDSTTTLSDSQKWTQIMNVTNAEGQFFAGVDYVHTSTNTTGLEAVIWGNRKYNMLGVSYFNNKIVNRVFVSPNGGNIYVATNSGVSISSSGNSFSDKTKSNAKLISNTINDVATTADGKVVVAATPSGLSISRSEGSYWSNVTTGLPSTDVKRVVIVSKPKLTSYMNSLAGLIPKLGSNSEQNYALYTNQSQSSHPPYYAFDDKSNTSFQGNDQCNGDSGCTGSKIIGEVLGVKLPDAQALWKIAVTPILDQTTYKDNTYQDGYDAMANFTLEGCNYFCGETVKTGKELANWHQLPISNQSVFNRYGVTLHYDGDSVDYDNRATPREFLVNDPTHTKYHYYRLRVIGSVNRYNNSVAGASAIQFYPTYKV
ncbi:hypothetical protein, partial [Fangia hongkongensis]|uniref:hypothetical protein n=1 Tax=Fangia hongkongensis TaxID=270495 RepID=UPI0019089F83